MLENCNHKWEYKFECIQEYFLTGRECLKCNKKQNFISQCGYDESLYEEFVLYGDTYIGFWEEGC